MNVLVENKINFSFPKFCLKEVQKILKNAVVCVNNNVKKDLDNCYINHKNL
jgi:hypothetical protein